MIQLEDTPWTQPIHYEDDGFTLVGRQWYAGEIAPSGGTETHRYEFDALAGTMAVQSAAGEVAPVMASADGLTPGTWVLGVRLQLGHLQAAVIPVVNIEVSESGQATYTAYLGQRGAVLNPCPERMLHTDACRQLAARNAATASK